MFSFKSYGQVEFTTWGNITGIRVDNQLMEFNTSLMVIDTNNVERITALEKQKVNFKRENGLKTFSFEMDSLNFNQSIKSPEKGKAELEIDFYSKVDTIINGAYFRLNLPKEFDRTTVIKIKENENSDSINFLTEKKDSIYSITAKSIKIIANKRQLEIDLTTATNVLIKPNSKAEL